MTVDYLADLIDANADELAKAEAIDNGKAISFAKAVDVIASIEKMKSDRGNITFDERTNTIIVTDIDKHIKLIKIGLIFSRFHYLNNSMHYLLKFFRD